MVTFRVSLISLVISFSTACVSESDTHLRCKATSRIEDGQSGYKKFQEDGWASFTIQHAEKMITDNWESVPFVEKGSVIRWEHKLEGEAISLRYQKALDKISRTYSVYSEAWIQNAWVYLYTTRYQCEKVEQLF